MGLILSIVLLFTVLLIILLFSFKDDILQSKYLETFKNNEKYLTQPDLHNLIIFLEKTYNTHVVIPHKIKYTKENNQYHIHNINITGKNTPNDIDIIFTPNKNIVTSLFLFNTFGTYHININQDTDYNQIPDYNIDSIIDNEIISNNDYINITSEDNIEPDSDINTTESIINLFS
jgi:hypothetical protein